MFAVFIQLMPKISHNLSSGPNTSESLIKTPIHADIYGLKIRQLLSPTNNHQNQTLREAKEIMNKNTYPITEGGSSSMGIVSSIGFIILLVWIFIPKKLKSDPKLQEDSELITKFSLLNYSLLLIATSGGVGTLIAYIFPDIRTYSRMSIFITFFSLTTILFIIDRWTKKISSKTPQNIFFKNITFFIAAIIIIIGVWDQTPLSISNNIKVSQISFDNDVKFFEQLEKSIPTGSMVYQLPYMIFPESEPIENMGDYEHFRAYLQTKHIKWSYSSIKGREGDTWNKSLIDLDPPEFIEELKEKGFNGLYINKRGYKNYGKDIENIYTKLLDKEPARNYNDTLIFFDIT
ncbi:hypothetical protein C0581_03265 [Candidatus Parcubacteria bacterium]|nr:MAG: hypothetical protein C0581_03265 [Candidatus Parcubacteria bacterium]